jgi:hypothetical protein
LTKKGDLLADRDVSRWYNNLMRGSEHTAEIALRRLSLYCELNKTSPRKLLQLAPRRSITKANFDLLCDTVTKLEKEGKKGSYIDGIRKSVVSWLRFNEIAFKDRIKIDGAKVSSVTTKTPDPSEVLQILAAAPLRTKVAISLVAYSGLRLETLGDLHGTNGLTLGDFPQLVLKSEIRFTENPAQVLVRNRLSKAGHQYFSLLNGKASECIVASLRERVAKGEKLSVDTPLIRAFGMKRTGGEFVGTPNISWEIKRAITRAGFNCRPYDLRAFFDTQLLIAENRGKIARDFRVFFMGHKGTIESVYTTNRNTLSDSILSEMKSAYVEASKFLSGSVETVRASEMFEAMELLKYETQVQTLQSIGRIMEGTPAEIVKHKEDQLGRKLLNQEKIELFKSVLDRLEIKEHTQLFENDDGRDNPVLQRKLAERRKPFTDGKERTVTQEELPEWQEKGYKTKLQLRNGNLVIEPPV